MPVPIPLRYRGLVNEAAGETGLPAQVVASQIQEESDWDPNAVSPAGAEGIAQFEPSTWRQYGQGGSPFNPRDAFRAYGEYMAALMSEEGEVWRNALAAYNAGPGNLPAGYSYADKILSDAGYKDSSRGKAAPYANPLRDVQGLTPERVDMGVDYGGTGPIYALGPGVITSIFNHGWGPPKGAAPGAFIAERLSSGPLAGHYVYAAEGIDPSVQVGQQVDSSTKIGTLTGGGIETGFAAPPGTGDALGASQFGGSNATAYGKAYSDVLHDLGAPAGIVSGPVEGKLPGWLANVGKGLSGTAPSGGGGGGGGILGIPSDIGNALTSIASTLGEAEQAVAWFLNPGHWVRIFCGIGGTFFVIWGLWSISRTGRAYSATVPVVGSVPVPEGGQLAPALGIASVTVGAVLLFVAFHNLDPSVTDFGSLVSHLQREIQSGGARASA